VVPVASRSSRHRLSEPPGQRESGALKRATNVAGGDARRLRPFR
jgi:hypothetical protein